MEKYTTFEEELNRSGYLIHTNKGTSMMPLLRENRDLMHIRKPQGRLKKYDVPLYKTDDGRYVLHRILKVTENGYVICGDHCIHREYNITDKHIIGVLEGVTRDEKYIPVTDKKYLCYVHLWCDFFYIRIAIIWFKQKIRGLLGRIKKLMIKN